MPASPTRPPASAAYGLFLALALALLLAGCAGIPERPNTPIRAATSPDDILACEPATAEINTLHGEDYVCSGLRIRERCERKTALYYGIFNQLECSRSIDEARHEWNMALAARALFWRDAGCGLAQSRAGHDAAPIGSFLHDGKVRFVVEGCGQARRYDCDQLPDHAYSPVAPRCAPARGEVSAFAEALAETKALFRAATGCATAEIDPERRSRGPVPDEGVTEIILAGCGQSVPYTCALELRPNVRHAGQCEAEQPKPEVLADAKTRAARVYAEAAGCGRLGVEPRLTAQPVTLTREGRFEQVFLAEGCAARARVRCKAPRLRARRMDCSVDETSAPPEAAARSAALDTARRLHPGCAFTLASKWGGGPLTARMSVEGTCQGEPLVTELSCDADPVTGAPRCEIDAERERVGTEGRALTLARYAKETGCPREQTQVVGDRMMFVNGRYTRVIRVTGCKDTLELSCRTRDDATNCTTGW